MCVRETLGSINWTELEAKWAKAAGPTWNNNVLQTLLLAGNDIEDYGAAKKTACENYQVRYAEVQKEALKLSKRVGVPRQGWGMLMPKKEVCQEFTTVLTTLQRSNGKASTASMLTGWSINLKSCRMLWRRNLLEQKCHYHFLVGRFVWCEGYARTGCFKDVFETLDVTGGVDPLGVATGRVEIGEALALLQHVVEMILMSLWSSKRKGALEDADAETRVANMNSLCKALKGPAGSLKVLCAADMANMKLLGVALGVTSPMVVWATGLCRIRRPSKVRQRFCLDS